MKSDVAQVKITTYHQSVTQALDEIGAAEHLPKDRLIILKPNLTNADPAPVTTPVDIVEAVYLYCKTHCTAPIIIAEGCGSGTTKQTYQANGYRALTDKYGLPLVDLNQQEVVTLSNPHALVLKQFHIPKIVLDAFIISIPVLKDHSMTTITVAMKNMFGIAPGSHYAGSWNKSRLHTPSTHKSVVDICLYKKPDLCVVDAVVALQGMHLSGTSLYLNTILAGFDPVAVDAVASRLLGHDPKSIEYLCLADGLLGTLPQEKNKINL